MRPPALDDDHETTQFQFRRYTTHEDETGICFHMCCKSRCIRNGRRVPCFHRDCYSVKLLPISSNFLAATDYVFSPPIRFELERQERIKRTLARNLGLGSLRQLPQDVCYMIAGYLYRQLAAIACQDVARHLYPSNSTFDLTHDVYATYVSIEGISYLQSLQNSPLGNDTKGRRILDARQGHIIRTIYVAYDHVGIRNIYFELPKRDDLCNSSLDCCGVWWKQLARNIGLVRIVTQSDVSLSWLRPCHYLS